MRVRNLHGWNVTYEEARRIQENLREQLILRDDGIPKDIGLIAGDYAHLILDNDVVGAVVKTKKDVKPLFVSQGHKIGLERSIEIILASCRGYRLPEPTRQAHLTINRIRESSTQGKS